MRRRGSRAHSRVCGGYRCSGSVDFPGPVINFRGVIVRKGLLLAVVATMASAGTVVGAGALARGTAASQRDPDHGGRARPGRPARRRDREQRARTLRAGGRDGAAGCAAGARFCARWLRRLLRRRDPGHEPERRLVDDERPARSPARQCLRFTACRRRVRSRKGQSAAGPDGPAAGNEDRRRVRRRRNRRRSR